MCTMAFERITVNAEQMGGVPCIRGLRIPVATAVATLADGMTRWEILEAYPDLEAEDIRGALSCSAAARKDGLGSRWRSSWRISLRAGGPGSRKPGGLRASPHPCACVADGLTRVENSVDRGVVNPTVHFGRPCVAGTRACVRYTMP
jgi:uncharacterized protein (DUF433 family)